MSERIEAMIGERRTITPEERIHSWIALGADPAEARWHAALAAVLEAWHGHLIPGRIVTCADLGLLEERTFDLLSTRLDLPPEVEGVFLPPSLSAHFAPPFQGKALRRAPGHLSQLLLLGSPLEPQRLLAAELAQADNASGVDLYKKGCRIVAQTLQEDPTTVLSELAWHHLGPRVEPSPSSCILYTEWWFRRCAALGRADLPLHIKFSYLHHPERIGLDPLEAVFRLTEAVLPDICEALQGDAVDTDGPTPDLTEAVEVRLVGLLDLLRKAGSFDFGALRGEAETRFKEGFARTVAQTCARLAP